MPFYPFSLSINDEKFLTFFSESKKYCVGNHGVVPYADSTAESLISFSTVV